uniref:Lipoyl(octanoyl) transferase 2 n=1 Tax=Eptatretus burgeri TaxID=7764 RepID=A0A8C4R850_EPTBU
MPRGVVPPLYVLRLGRVPYAQAMAVQNQLVRSHRHHKDRMDPPWKEGSQAPDVLVLCEHDPVYTVGLQQALYPSDEEARLRKLGADFQRTDRGGLITFFGPGLLMAYPVINLARRRCSLRLHVDQLRAAATTACRALGVEKAEPRGPPETGVWMGNNKLCAIGGPCIGTFSRHGLERVKPFSQNYWSFLMFMTFCIQPHSKTQCAFNLSPPTPPPLPPSK